MSKTILYSHEPKPIEQEPKRTRLFEVKFPKELGIESFLVQKISAPSCSLNDFLKLKWDDIKITFLDPVGPSASVKLFNFKKYFETNEEFVFDLDILDPTGLATETWKITAFGIKEINFGDRDYGSHDIVYLTLVLEISDCVLY